MTPERIRELAEEAWRDTVICDGGIKALESAFLELEREVREECAKVCEEPEQFQTVGEIMGNKIWKEPVYRDHWECAAAIRGRTDE